MIDLVPKSQGITGTTLAGSFTEENCAEYARDYQAICPRIRNALQHPGLDTRYDYAFITEAEMDRDRVYSWFAKHGLRYYLGSALADTPNYMVFFSLQRTQRQGHAQAEDIARFDLLKPHLARAASFADQLGTLHCLQRLGSEFLEAMPQAVFALASNGLVVFANRKARQLLEAGDGVSVQEGQLRGGGGAEQEQLDQLIHSSSAAAGSASAWARLSRPSGRLPYAVFVSPFQLREDEDLAAVRASVLVTIHDPAERRCADIQMLTRLYGLTETEARLASALSGGHSVETSAALLQMQPGTARGHLKSVFRKTGVSRQQDLVRLLTSLSMLAPISI